MAFDSYYLLSLNIIYKISILDHSATVRSIVLALKRRKFLSTVRAVESHSHPVLQAAWVKVMVTGSTHDCFTKIEALAVDLYL